MRLQEGGFQVKFAQYVPRANHRRRRRMEAGQCSNFLATVLEKWWNDNVQLPGRYWLIRGITAMTNMIYC